MAKFEITILGCGAPNPTPRHFTTCQVLNYQDKLYMFDCGEAAQWSMQKYDLKFSRLQAIFISHLHGDHYLGLPGLLSTMALNGRIEPITVYATPDAIAFFKVMMATVCAYPGYDIKYVEVNPDEPQKLFEDKNIVISSFPLYHRVPCVGYRFDEKPKPLHMRGDRLKELGVPYKEIPKIQRGEDYVREDGTVIPNSELTTPADPSLSYAYCSDTAADPRVAEAVKGCHSIYHEATYTDEYDATAADRGHATARQAARIAREAGCRQVILGHFSAQYLDESHADHLAQAQEELPGAILADEGLTVKIS